MDNLFLDYIVALQKPFKKIAKLEFLQPDNSVAFSLDNQQKRGFMKKYDSRAFIQSGSLTVSLQNGQRRKASVTLANVDGAFSYAVNNIWFGQRIRLSMGLVLPDGTNYYIPQGVFYIKDPVSTINPTTRQITYNLVDKWAYIDGTISGVLPYTYQVNQNQNIFSAMTAVLHLDKYNLSSATTDKNNMIDNVPPIYTDYYNGKEYTYKDAEGQTKTIAMSNTAYTVITESGNTVAKILLNLNDNLAGWIGYDQTGTLRVDPSQDDIDDSDKPIVWEFTPENSTLLGGSETFKNSEVYNDVIIVGEGLEDAPVYGRATNYDDTSDTNVNMIGLQTYREEKSEYWNSQQCVAYADWLLKRKTVLQRSITINCSQMFHLSENRLVTVKRTDKDGIPTERHIIQGYTLPISETGNMTITATSVTDKMISTITSSEV